MSVPFNPLFISRRTDANLASSSYLCVKATGDNDIDLAGAGEAVIGVLGDTSASPSDTNEKFVQVQVGGIVKVKFGGAVTAGVSVKADSNSEAVAATSDNDLAFGYALETAADGDIGNIVFGRHYVGA